MTCIFNTLITLTDVRRGINKVMMDLASLLIETDIEDLQDRVHQKYFWSLVGKETKHDL